MAKQQKKLPETMVPRRFKTVYFSDSQLLELLSVFADDNDKSFNSVVTEGLAYYAEHIHGYRKED
jgi:hypothetical protein